MSSRRNKDRTVTRSFRISERCLKALEDEAKRQNVGVSTLLNQQLLAFADFDRYMRRLGLVKMSSGTFERILKICPDDGIEQVGREAGSDVPRSIVTAKHGAFKFDTVIDFLGIMSEFSGQFEFGDLENNGRRVITILHRFGPKGSRFFASYMKALFEGMDFTPKVTSSDTSVLIVIPSGNQTQF